MKSKFLNRLIEVSNIFITFVMSDHKAKISIRKENVDSVTEASLDTCFVKSGG
jgi:hypothetical protein